MDQVGSWRNQERTGKRKVTKLSSVARKVADVRHVDIDLTQWCPGCKRPQVFAEVKRRVVSDHEWDQVRRHAAYYAHGCLGLLVIEGDTADIGVKVYDPVDDTISPVVWGEESYLQEVLERARDSHLCW
jgi:hypothetical protein